MADYPWIITRDSTMGFECLRCGQTAAVTLPCPIPVWSAAAKAFIGLHRRCEVAK